MPETEGKAGGGICAAVDIGSNSVKLFLATRAGGLDAPLMDAVRICGLGRDLDRSGRLADNSMDEALDVLAELTASARALGVTEFAAVGTMALRRAANGESFLARVRERCGLDVLVISGEEEARLSFKAADSALPPSPESRLLFDVGGGSTEFILGRGDDSLRCFSLDTGCLRHMETHQRNDPPSRDELRAMLASLAEEFRDLPSHDGELVGIGGTASTLGAVELGLDEWAPEAIEGLRLGLDRVEVLLEGFRRLPLEERAELPGLHPRRAPIIVAGAAIILAIMRRVGALHLTLSGRALRHGLWLDRWGGGP